MGLLGRAGEIIRAKFSALLNRAENPNETLDYSYEKQLESLQNVKRGIADVVTAKKRLQLQTSQLEQNVVKLDTQARPAVAVNREDLARAALERKSGIQQQLQQLDGQVQQLDDQQQKLVANEQQLSAKIEQFRSQKEVIKAQYSAAVGQVRIGEAAAISAAPSAIDTVCGVLMIASAAEKTRPCNRSGDRSWIAVPKPTISHAMPAPATATPKRIKGRLVDTNVRSPSANSAIPNPTSFASPSRRRTRAAVTPPAIAPAP